MTVSPPEDGNVAFFSSGVTQRFSAADSVSSQYSNDERIAQVEQGAPAAAPSQVVQINAETAPKKGFIRLNGARMARTLDSDIDRSTTPTADHGFSGPSRTSTPLATARNMYTMTTQMQNAHIGQVSTPVVPIRTSSANAGHFWDSSRFQPGPTSQIIPSLPTKSAVPSGPVLLRDMSFSSRKSMVGEMGEYKGEYEDDSTAPSHSPPRSIQRGKSAEELSPERAERPPLTNRNSRMHYTRRPAPPPPVPPIPALYLPSDGKEAVSPTQKTHATESDQRRSSTHISNNRHTEHTSIGNQDTLSPRSTMQGTKRPSDNHLTAEERRAKLAEDYLTKGIEAHNDSKGIYDLGESAYYFRKAAEGGSSGGCVMYGLALRHGWGVAQDEKAAFNWFGKACETTMLADDRQGASNGDLLAKKEKSKLTPELIMALYEVGNCFFHGWGLPHPDYPMAVSYFQLAAESGDKDAQEQLGLILSQGKPGVKKDMYTAAKWYRTAIAQGASGVGLSWIYKVVLVWLKDKYMNPPTGK
ncbi:hypothetical protein QFC22_003851 [Naganishia vaughanmartiniae]|uniref:Uncharacterized protein n=1 Tax=Naganishia vaughanmartiniae TaxID=1424756 RepID=A0ACC2X6E7_9TREE|nr:hypothetical protein QFC22_003851 [Naganishia vaughanmartiniae]